MYLTAISCIAFGTGATVRLHTVVTHTTVEAGLRVAFVNLVLAVVAREAGATRAREAVDLIHTASLVKTGAARQTKSNGHDFPRR